MLRKTSNQTSTHAHMALLVAMLLTPMLLTLMVQEINAAPLVAIVSITPESGCVGDIARVIGEIDTPNGTYLILFGEENVKQGSASGTAVDDTFVVPNKTMGSYNVKLHDVSTKNNGTIGFNVETAYYVEATLPPKPEQLLEGNSIQIWMNVTGGAGNTHYVADVTVTDPSGAVYYKDAVQLTNTTNKGYGEGSVVYPDDFSSGAHTEYAGVYDITFNGTVALGNFTVGLTDRLEYARGEIVHIHGAGYYPTELVTVNLTKVEATINGYPKNVTADINGVISDSWEVPINATFGTYTVTLANGTTPGTVKSLPDMQNFTVFEVIVYCQAQNRYDDDPLSKVIIQAHLGGEPVTSGRTNGTGWVDFRIDGGQYTFKASWKGEEVGSLDYYVPGNVVLILPAIKCKLANVIVAISDEEGRPLPAIDVILVSNETMESLETNSIGIAATNALTNIEYMIEVRRYGHLFEETQIEQLNSTFRINMTCPTYSFFVYVVDSTRIPLPMVQVEVYEWGSQILMQNRTTDGRGSTTFDCTFGRYSIRVFDYNADFKQKTLLNETVVDLLEDQIFVLIDCKIVNVKPQVSVVDYFGHPIPNARVEIQRKNGQEWKTIEPSPQTDSEGFVSLPGIGGDYRISVYIKGEICEAKTLYLEESKVIEFKINKYVVFGTYVLGTSQLFTYISIAILVTILSLLFMRGKVFEIVAKSKTSHKSES